MPTSDSKGSAPLWRRVLIALLVVAVLVVADVALTLALEPYGGNTETVWYEYREHLDEQIGTLVVGTSVSQNGINPQPLTERLGEGALNLSSPCQSLDSSLAAIRLALDDHPEIHRVLLGTSYSELESADRLPYAASFAQAMSYGRSPIVALRSLARLTANTAVGRQSASLACLAPYALNHVDFTPSAIRQNIQRRLDCASPLEARSIVEPSCIDLGHGFFNYTGTADFSTTPWYEVVNRFVNSDSFNHDELVALQVICDLCAERNVELIVFSPPQPVFQTICVEELYPTNMALVQSIVEDRGGVFVDFNMIDPALYAASDEEFGDAIHLNADGAMRFSRLLADTITSIEAGDSLQERFFSYDRWNEYLETLDRIYFVYFDSAYEDGSLTLHAISHAGPRCNVEYLFEVQEEDGSWTKLGEWSSSPDLVFTRGGYQTYNVRVLARQAGATEPERYHYQTLTQL